jgi:hypothetical protein
MEVQEPEPQSWMNFSLSKSNFNKPDDFSTNGFKFDVTCDQPEQGQLQIEPNILY